eukprot:SAG22_NODE_1404_length_4491_cov_3.411885_4_plen_567_part_00
MPPDQPGAEYRAYAMKVFRMAQLRKQMRGGLRRRRGKGGAPPSQADVMVEHEIAVMKKLDHPNVCKLKEVIHDEKGQMIYLVSEYLCGGSLEQFRLQCDGGRVPMLRLQRILSDVGAGLAYLHESAGCAHCDLKPENIILISKVAEDAVAKIVDFRTAQILAPILTSQAGPGSGVAVDDLAAVKHVGTTAFYAPEMCDENHAGDIHWLPVDVWAFGVTAYQLGYGKLPHVLDGADGMNPWDATAQLMAMIASAPVVFPAAAEDADETELLFEDMLSTVLVAETTDDCQAERRATAAQLLDHPFLMLALCATGTAAGTDAAAPAPAPATNPTPAATASRHHQPIEPVTAADVASAVTAFMPMANVASLVIRAKSWRDHSSRANSNSVSGHQAATGRRQQHTTAPTSIYAVSTAATAARRLRRRAPSHGGNVGMRGGGARKLPPLDHQQRSLSLQAELGPSDPSRPGANTAGLRAGAVKRSKPIVGRASGTNLGSGRLGMIQEQQQQQQQRHKHRPRLQRGASLSELNPGGGGGGGGGTSATLDLRGRGWTGHGVAGAGLPAADGHVD